MSGTFLSRVQGFTPVIDVLTEELGLIPAAVYGVVWRYCQGPHGICQASLETIGAHLGLNWRTVHRHIKSLVKEGYLEDLTPNLRNHPHTYADAGRAVIEGLVQARVHRRALSESHSAPCQKVIASDSTMTLSHSHYDLESYEERRQDKRETTGEGGLVNRDAPLLAHRLWLATRDVLKAQLPPATYDTWIHDSHAVSLNDGVLVVGVRSAYAKDWLENRLYSTLQHAVSDVRGQPTSLRFIIGRNGQ